MQVTKAVITAASRRQRALPLQTITDSDGIEKTVLAIIIEEALAAGIDDICVIVAPGDEQPYAKAAAPHIGRLTFVEQPKALGYGHAIYCAQEFTAGQSFLHLVGDHLYVSQKHAGCAAALVATARSQSCTISAVQPSHESLLPYYGVVSGRRVPGASNLYEIDQVREKPTPTEAEQHLVVSGLRAGHYLCFFGMHVLTPAVMTILGQLLADCKGNDDALRNVTLSDAVAQLASRERYLAVEVEGHRYDVGVKYGILMAQLALALNGQDREQVLARLVGLLAHREQERGM